ncbi:conserved protein of unknown function [Candidatus Filomicrobium marinum]|uniref:2TM domain-containing protein n=2 Tax=Filomicrobium TaxID=119044 RepID=A0A0D6JG63_9HYPH|nr:MULTISPECIES: 2TM domain-containing protein [Filomicrobium]MCV0369875.1 2TM domain-containing protein [Filomicrobium sp.]CFX52556.1 conserved protein of unknown function [Candidatus Filomicrobium marinum]CPR20012.1 conserved protein of unknown function [Candidatus Filomicrobium marinum]SDP08638.1 2TM domain-containing protein [Filomicrobium insigne]
MAALQNTMKSVLADQGFRIHLIVYLAVNVLLFVINMMTNPNNLWFFWPLAGWGLGLIGHAFAVYQSVRTAS